MLRSPTVEAYLLGRSFVVGNATAIAQFNLGWTLQAPRTIPQVGLRRAGWGCDTACGSREHGKAVACGQIRFLRT